MDKMNGLLVVDKPKDWTSHDVVAFVRKRFKVRKAGHAGTLDPIATGVLLLLVGNMTKCSSQLMKEDKEYDASMKLGVTTTTQDAYGKVVEERDSSGVTREQVEKAFRKFTGEIEQVPPMVSAKKFKGKKLYELARKGITVKRDGRMIKIHELTLRAFDPPIVSFHVVSSKGTYIRTLCEDIGNSLGCGSHLTALRRVRSGKFAVDRSITVDALRNMSAEEFRSCLIDTSSV